MRQGNGAELLGLNDPRSGSIGVIYVSPTDDRQSVFAAILTQEKLNRKQIAIVLPDRNKAFQQPRDFDDLKLMRKKLQADVVFIAPSGPGPAAFARQRNFLVYSSLENYAKALETEDVVKGNEGNKRGWFIIGGGKQKPAHNTSSATSSGSTRGSNKTTTTPANGTNSAVKPASAEPAIADSPTVVIAPAFAQPQEERKPVAKPERNGLPLVASTGGAVAADAIANNHPAATMPALSPTSPFGDLGADDALPPIVPAAKPVRQKVDINAVPPVPLLASNSAIGANADPGIIELGATRGKTTVKLPVERGVATAAPVVVPVEAKPTSAPVSRASRNSGKTAAVGAGIAGGVAGATLARSGGGGVPPARASTGGSGGGGAGRRAGVRALALILLLLLSLLICGGIAYSQPKLLGSLSSIVSGAPPKATVAIVPASKTVSDKYAISGVPGASTDETQRKVNARILTANSQTQTKTVDATGVKQTPATTAKGTLTFYNSLSTEQTIGITTFTLANGVQIVNDTVAVVPAANLPTTGFKTVSAHAVTAGTAGNIGAYTLNKPCCVDGITVQNTVAFTGGQDAENYKFVQQSDIDNAAVSLEGSLIQQATNGLEPQIKSNEQLVASPTCTPSVGSNPSAGAKAPSVTVSVSASCRAEVYDQSATNTIAMDLLKKKATAPPDTNYKLVDDIVTELSVQKVEKDIVILSVAAKGVWEYAFTTQREDELKKLVVGRSAADATTILKSQQGVSDVTISPSGAALPTDPNEISITVTDVHGFHVGNTSGGPSLTPTITGPGARPTPVPGLGGGSSGGGS